MRLSCGRKWLGSCASAVCRRRTGGKHLQTFRVLTALTLDNPLRRCWSVTYSMENALAFSVTRTQHRLGSGISVRDEPPHPTALPPTTQLQTSHLGPNRVEVRCLAPQQGTKFFVLVVERRPTCQFEGCVADPLQTSTTICWWTGPLLTIVIAKEGFMLFE